MMNMSYGIHIQGLDDNQKVANAVKTALTNTGRKNVAVIPGEASDGISYGGRTAEDKERDHFIFTGPKAEIAIQIQKELQRESLQVNNNFWLSLLQSFR